MIKSYTVFFLGSMAGSMVINAYGLVAIDTTDTRLKTVIERVGCTEYKTLLVTSKTEEQLKAYLADLGYALVQAVQSA